MSSTANTVPASKLSRWALVVAIILLIGSPAWGFQDPPHRVLWLLPLGMGFIPIGMGAIGIVQIRLCRPMRGLRVAILAILLGFAASCAGMLFMLSGAVGRELMW